MDGGDCAACLSRSGIDPQKIGDGICQMELNTTECGWDGHDCLASPKLPPCIVEHEHWLGDGFCGESFYDFLYSLLCVMMHMSNYRELFVQMVGYTIQKLASTMAGTVWNAILWYLTIPKLVRFRCKLKK
jgi:hypothetical protein